jgi:polyisoprenoid-binding protein YceI
MTKLLALTASMLAFPMMACAQMTPVAQMPSGVYTLDDSHTSVTWKVSHLGLSNYTARFAKAEAKLTFDAKDPTKSTLVASVDPLSIKTDYPDADKKDFDAKLAKDPEWFNAGKFPTISFASTKIEKTGETTGKVHGNLTMLGVTKPLVLDVTFNGGMEKKPFAEVPALGFSATAKLKRSDWGFATYVPTIGDEVTVLIETELHKAK